MALVIDIQIPTTVTIAAATTYKFEIGSLKLELKTE